MASIRSKYPNLYGSALKSIVGTEYESRTKELYPELSGEALLEEAFNTALAEKNTLLSEEVANRSKLGDLIDYVKRIINKFTSEIKKILGIKEVDIPIEDMTLDDFVNKLGSQLFKGEVIDSGQSFTGETDTSFAKIAIPKGEPLPFDGQSSYTLSELEQIE